MSLLRWVARYRAGRFLIDFWFSPRKAWHRYTQKRTWPTRGEFDRMSNEDFGAYLASIGKRRRPPMPPTDQPREPQPVAGVHEDSGHGGCVTCRRYVIGTDDEYTFEPFPCPTLRLADVLRERDEAVRLLRGLLEWWPLGTTANNAAEARVDAARTFLRRFEGEPE